MHNEEILITGGTGSLGKTLVKLLKTKYETKGIRIFSRSELNQSVFKKEMKELGIDSNVVFIIGDIRDSKRIELATRGVDTIINCAAMKRIEVCEENPYEAVQVNAVGVQNIIQAAIDNKVKKVFQISTDKAVYPITLYGATKLTAEGLIRKAEVYTGGHGPKFACARYGNVFGSNGSVVRMFQDASKWNKDITITHPDMTRFWITLPKVAQFIVDRIEDMKGGEIFVPFMPVLGVPELAKYITPHSKIKQIGLRGVEKIHEVLVTEEESWHTTEHFWHQGQSYYKIDMDAKRNDTGGWSYNSGDKDFCNTLTKEQVLEMVETL